MLEYDTQASIAQFAYMSTPPPFRSLRIIIRAQDRTGQGRAGQCRARLKHRRSDGTVLYGIHSPKAQAHFSVCIRIEDLSRC